MKIWKKPSPITTAFERGRYQEPADQISVWEPAPAGARRARPKARRGALRALIGRYRHFLLLVVLPTALAAVYFVGVAADQYVSEARYLVRGRQGGGGSALTALLPGMTVGPAREDAQGVRDFIQSHDAVARLRERIDLVDMFRRPEADPLSRLWYADPSAEELLKFFRGQVTASFDATDGITTLRVRAFRPEDARAIADELLRQSEALVNRFSERAQADTLRVARDEVARAEARVLAAREAITQFRRREQAVDPQRSAVIALDTIGRLEAQLVQARADLQEKSAYLRADNPQIAQLRNRVDALTRQVSDERARLTTGDATLAQQIASYERLILEREFADRQLASATTSAEASRMEAQRQQLFLVRVVEPNTAEEALYPRRIFILLSIFVALSVAYGVGWLIVAGVREHAL
ncbi:capsule biosynthesis protein [Roseomonas sp. NAR14]|uniref:Capsule biosynthesis protein n=1 Tax=Roseomonas acroporae TaxID=2937791 RepID=A0A9X1Y7N8_9PROT|nr:capsule biosynthesis protein [Roseomonas acroporae]MCK8784597.1 capsule biosynthesis protein [Roseomonas acroporae]